MVSIIESIQLYLIELYIEHNRAQSIGFSSVIEQIELSFFFTTSTTEPIKRVKIKPSSIELPTTTASWYQNGPQREQFRPLIMTTMRWIETHQPQYLGL